MDGVVLTRLKQVPLEKGDIMHALKVTDESFSGFGEAYFTKINYGCIKGWKRHNRMTLNLVVVVGKVKFVVYDEINNCFEEIILSPTDNYQRLTLKPGLWMSFQGMSKDTSIVLDIIPEPHDPSETDNKSISDFNYTF